MAAILPIRGSNGPDGRSRCTFYARQALLAISWSLSMMGDLELSDEESNAASVAIALDILTRM